MLFCESGLLRGFADNPPNVFCSTDCKAETETDLPGEPGLIGGRQAVLVAAAVVCGTWLACCACDWMPGVMTPLPGHLTLSGQTNTLITISQPLPQFH